MNNITRADVIALDRIDRARRAQVAASILRILAPEVDGVAFASQLSDALEYISALGAVEAEYRILEIPRREAELLALSMCTAVPPWLIILNGAARYLEADSGMLGIASQAAKALLGVLARSSDPGIAKQAVDMQGNSDLLSAPKALIEGVAKLYQAYTVAQPVIGLIGTAAL